MHKLFQHTRSYRFVERLQELVDSYNSSPHRTLCRELTPKEINKKNEAEVWDRMYNSKYTAKTIKDRQFKLGIGDLVRLSYKRYTFQRDYQRKWSSKIFKSSDRFVRQNTPIYKVKGLPT